MKTYFILPAFLLCSSVLFSQILPQPKNPVAIASVFAGNPGYGDYYGGFSVATLPAWFQKASEKHEDFAVFTRWSYAAHEDTTLGKNFGGTHIFLSFQRQNKPATFGLSVSSISNAAQDGQLFNPKKHRLFESNSIEFMTGMTFGNKKFLMSGFALTGAGWSYETYSFQSPIQFDLTLGFMLRGTFEQKIGRKMRIVCDGDFCLKSGAYGSTFVNTRAAMSFFWHRFGVGAEFSGMSGTGEGLNRFWGCNLNYLF